MLASGILKIKDFNKKIVVLTLYYLAERGGMDMNTFVYGTGNPAKLTYMRKMITPLDVQIIGLKEIDATLPKVDESGNTPLENARIKALAYYEVLKRPVFACDSGMYIDGLSEDEQPGIHVRMVNGKRLSDDEMVAHYAAIAGRLGGKAVARYRNAICLAMGNGEIYEHFGDDIASEAFYIVDTPHIKRVEGFPLDSLSVNIHTGRYYYEESDVCLDNDGGMTCGFRAFFKQILEQHEMKKHYDALIDENNDPVHDPEPLREYMDKWDGAAFIEALQLSPDKSVLEIGVGTGRLAIRVCGQCYRFTGIDISSKTIEHAKGNLQAFTNTELICGNFLAYQFGNTFDVIYSSLTFLHIQDKRAAIQKVAGLLNRGGLFVLSIDKNQQTEIDFGNRKVAVYPDSPKEISRLISEAGLILERQFETEFAVIFVAQKEDASCN